MRNAYWSHASRITHYALRITHYASRITHHRAQPLNTGSENDMRPWPGSGTDYRKASVLILLYPRSGEDYVIFTRRTDTVEHHKGQISLPGGSQDPADLDAVYTALRETQEELGVDPDLPPLTTDHSPLQYDAQRTHTRPHNHSHRRGGHSGRA